MNRGTLALSGKSIAWADGLLYATPNPSLTFSCCVITTKVRLHRIGKLRRAGVELSPAGNPCRIAKFTNLPVHGRIGMPAIWMHARITDRMVPQVEGFGGSMHDDITAEHRGMALQSS